MRPALQLILALALSGFFLWLVLRVIPLAGLAAALRGVHPFWVVMALAAFFLGYACRIWRWRLMLAETNPALGWGRCAVPFTASVAANNLLPFRSGDALRAVAFSGWLGVPTASILATLLVERLLDVLALMLALVLALVLVWTDLQALQALLGPGVALLGLLGAVVTLTLLMPQVIAVPVMWGIGRLEGRLPGLTERLRVQSARLFGTLAALAHRSRLVRLMLWSLLAWGLEAAVFYAVARAIPGLAVPASAWLAMPVGTLSTLIPSTPGYVGTFHYFVMTTARMLGNDAAAAAAFAVLVHLSLWVPTTLWGGLSFVYWMLTRTAPSGTSRKAVLR